jgi:hypothetical protein
MAIADVKLAPELRTSVESLIHTGRLALEEFSIPIANHLLARARLLKKRSSGEVNQLALICSTST